MSKIRSEIPVEKQANCEKNDSLLLFDRVSHPRIRDQIIDLLYRAELGRKEHPGRKITVNDDGTVTYSENNYDPKSREQIADELNDRLKAVRESTPIMFDGASAPHMDLETGREKMPVIWGEGWSPLKKDVPTLKQKSIIEAHEKGHVLRPYGEWSRFFRHYFAAGFDVARAVFSPEEIEEYKRNLPEKLSTDDHAVEEIKQYLFSPSEIAERMSQLKNYFGFRSNEKFTHEHLEYARRHYVNDTQLDNGMTQFFQAISSETEPTFLEIINNSGI
jgi:hypothetical protein